MIITSDMSNVQRWPDCSQRTDLGNCSSIGGFCTSVSYEICEALHSAYFDGYYEGSKAAWEKALNTKTKERNT